MCYQKKQTGAEWQIQAFSQTEELYQTPPREFNGLARGGSFLSSSSASVPVTAHLRATDFNQRLKATSY